VRVGLGDLSVLKRDYIWGDDGEYGEG
jgi:hypothetical protein